MRYEVEDVLATCKDVSGTVIESGTILEVLGCKEVGESVLLAKGKVNSSKTTSRDI